MPCPSHNGCPRNDGALQDYHGLNFHTPARVYAPTSKAELVAAVIDIESSGMRAKAVGSNMSLSQTSRADDCAILTDKLNRHLSKPLNGGDITWPDRPGDRFRRTESILGSILSDATLNKQPKLVFIEGGMKIRELVEDLAHTSNPGLALPAMGAGGAQSIAGALATGTHGAEIDRQPLIDAIRAVHLVGPGGQEWWIERTNGFSEKDRLQEWIPEWCSDMRIVYDDRMFYSAILSAGRLGVIYSLVLELEPEYWLDERRITQSFSPVREALSLSASSGFDAPSGILRTRNGGEPGLRFLQIDLNPNDLSRCWVQERRLHSGSHTEVEVEKKGSLLDSFCQPAKLIPILLELVKAITLLIDPLAHLPPPPPLDPIGALIHWILDQVNPAARFRRLLEKIQQIASRSGNLGEFMSVALTECPEFIGQFVPIVLDIQQGQPAQRVGPSRKILDMLDYTHIQNDTHGFPFRSPKCINGDGGEFFFNARSTQYLNFVDDLNKIAGDLGGIPGYISLRFVRQSDAYIAMEQFPVTVAVELSYLTPWNAGAAYLLRASEAAASRGGIPHWGQSCSVPRTSQTYFGTGLDCFHYAVARTQEGFSNTFSSAFSRASGLDPTESLQTLATRVERGKVSVRSLLSAAQSKLVLSSKPKSIREVALEFEPSLRMNPNQVPLPRGKCASLVPGIRLRDVSQRIL